LNPFKLKKLQILFLTHRFYPFAGGIEVNSEILATYFAKAGHEVTLTTWTESIAEKNWNFEVVRNPSYRKLIALHRWADAIFENNICLRLSLPNLLIRKPRITAIRMDIGGAAGGKIWHHAVKFWWLGRTQDVIAVSDAVRQRNWKDALVIGNPYRDELFEKKNSKRGPLNFAFLGRLVSDKGCDLAIEAIMLVAEKLAQSVTLNIIGAGPEEADLRRRAAKSVGKAEINFLGEKIGDEIVEILNQQTYLIVPTKTTEAFGNVVLEGMACGCIPIVSNTGGLPEAAGKAGAVFPSQNREELVQLILELIGDETRRNEYMDEAQEHLRHHTPKAVSSRYLKVIEEATNKFRG